MATHMKKNAPHDPRRDAVLMLTALNDRRLTLDRLLEDIDRKEYDDPRDRAFLNALVFGVLRWRGRLDWIIRHFSSIGLHKIDPKVLNILRLGLYQVLYLDRVPVSAAVHTSVELAKQAAAPWVVKFVNAVMRKMASDHTEVPDPAAAASAAAGISIEKSMPEWLVTRWLDRFGTEETLSLCDAANALAPITVRTNTLRIDRDRLHAALETSAERVIPTRHAPEGLSLFGNKTPIGRMSAYLKGHFQVQDEAAQLIGYLVGPCPGETILDACAGLGGKTGHLAQLMENNGRIVAMDISDEKLCRLQTEMRRLGIDIVTTVTADLTKPAELSLSPQFDRILLDAPCTGLGVLRRNPDTKWRVLPKDIQRCARRQTRLLHHLAPLVKPGGFLIYGVCSTEPEENEQVVENFLSSHADFITAPVHCDRDIERECLTPEGCYRSFPHRHQMDGFFGARFHRRH